MKMIFKWRDNEGRRMSSPRELAVVPRKGDSVLVDSMSAAQEIVDVVWLIRETDTTVLVYLYPEGSKLE